MSAGRGGTVFDEDPKRWRLIAEGFTTSGRALEIATAVFPQQFVLLAGVLVTVSTKVGQARGRVGKGQKGGLGAGIWLCLQLQCCLFLPVILLHGMSL